MKLGKDEYQKIFLGCLLLRGLLYYYFSMLLGPLDHQEEVATNNLKTWIPMIDTDKKAIKEVKELKTKAEAADSILDQIKTLIPDGSPVAWFPPLITDFFKRQGIEKCVVHHIDEGPDRDLVGFRKAAWGIEINHVEVVQLALAIAAFENEHPLMEIDNLQIDASKENPQFQSAKLNITTIIKQ